MTAEQTELASERQLIKLADACILLSYGMTKVRELIRAGVLETRGKGSGLRVVRRSLDAFVHGETACPAEKKSRPRHGRRAKAGTGKTSRAGTTTDSSATARSTKSRIEIPNGPKLDLKL